MEVPIYLSHCGANRPSSENAQESSKLPMTPQVSAGWQSIVTDLLDTIGDLPFRIVQIKEKFAQLRVYVDWLEEPTIEQKEAFQKAVELAQYKCAHTCEVCGQPGERIHNGWYHTRCKEHEDYEWN